MILPHCSDSPAMTYNHSITYCDVVKQGKLKLRGFLVSFSAANPCEAKNRYLLLQSGLPTNGIRENQDCPVTVDSGKPSDHKCSDALQQASLSL